MTIELQIANLPRARLDAVTGLVFAHGASGVQEDWMPGADPQFVQPWEERPDPEPEPVLLRVWFEELDQPTLLHALALLEVDDVVVRNVEPVDWQAEAEAQHEPVVISSRLVVAPPWDAPNGALIIEPGRGFGTGAHPTTRLALSRLDALADRHATLLDVGTGSGVVALAGARLGLRALGIDNDPNAVADAKRQRERNGLSAELTTTPVDQVVGTFDLVIANLNGPLLTRLAPAILDRVGCTLFVTGILPEHEQEVRQAFAILMLQERFIDDPWIGLQYTWPAS